MLEQPEQQHASFESLFGASPQNILDHLLEGCQIIGPDWRYLYVNRAAAEHGHHPREQLLGRTIMDVFPGIEETPVFSALRQCMADRVHGRAENEVSFPDGSKEWFDLRFHPVPCGIFILSMPIAERKRAELEHKRIEARALHLNAVLRGIRNVNQLITREKDGRSLIRKASGLLVEDRGFDSVIIALTDKSGEKVTAHAGAGPKVACLREMLDHGDPPDCAQEALTSREVVLRRDVRRTCVGCPGASTSRDDNYSLAIALEQQGKYYGFMIACLPGGLGDHLGEQDLLREVAEDLAFALYAMEIENERDKSAVALADTWEQLKQAQKLEVIGHLAGGVAHDFNNILTVILGFGNILQMNLSQGSPLRAYVDQIIASANKAADLTHGLLAFSRKQQLVLESHDVNDVIRSAVKILNRLLPEDIDVTMDLTPENATARLDLTQIDQVLMNFTTNARDAMPGGGTFSVKTEVIGLDEMSAKLQGVGKEGRYVRLTVGDTGVGMDDETRNHIFEPFFTTKEKGKGTGLGLSTVYGIVKQHEGYITVSSKPSGGTKFSVYLPVADLCQGQETDRPVELELGSETILIVEDDPDVRNMMKYILEASGYVALEAANGEEGVRIYGQRGDEIDLVILDVVMPGKNGKEVLDEMVRIDPRVKAIFVSGYTGEVLLNKGIQKENVDLLQKPVSVAKLLSKIRSVLDR